MDNAEPSNSTNHPFLAWLMDRSTLVALVKVLKVPFWNKKVVRVEYLEIFKGAMPSDNKVHIPTMWGKYDYDWYKKGEKSVLFSSAPEIISLGRVGRMPIIEIDGELFAESFADSIEDLAGLDPIQSDGRLLVKWRVLRDFLREHGNQG